MKITRLILYLVFAVYQIGAFVFTVMVDGHMDLLGLLAYIPAFKYISFLGVLLILTDIIFYSRDARANKRKQEALERENMVLKAKVYDYQEAEKKTAVKS